MTLQLIEERIELLITLLGILDDRVGIIDLKLEVRDSIWDATRQIASAVEAPDSRGAVSAQEGS